MRRQGVLRRADPRARRRRRARLVGRLRPGRRGRRRRAGQARHEVRGSAGARHADPRGRARGDGGPGRRGGGRVRSQASAWMRSVGTGSASGSSQQALLEDIVGAPLAAMGRTIADIDRYATELHNPEITESSGGGDVPDRNYRMLAGLGVVRGELTKEELLPFVRSHGLPGFSPTQGHIASAIPWLPHALARVRARRAAHDDVDGEGQPVPRPHDAAVGRSVDHVGGIDGDGSDRGDDLGAGEGGPRPHRLLGSRLRAVHGDDAGGRGAR